jgi:hypothetical protein
VRCAPKGPLADSIERYLAHRRSLGKHLTKVGSMLHLLDGYLLARGVPNERQIASTDLEGFIASRPRRSPRSYNGLVGAIRGLLDWMVVHEVLSESPLHCESRRTKVLDRLGRVDLLIVDDWAMAPMTELERRDFLEICDARYQTRSTLLTSQLPVASWHSQIGDPTIADSTLDRLVHNAHRTDLQGESMRKKRRGKANGDAS